MSEHFEGLEQAVRESATLEQRIAECRIRISRMCSEKRPPRMSIPVRWNDDDTFIVATLKDCDGLRAEVAALKAKLTAMHRRAQDAESAAMEKAGQTHGSLGRALANAGYNQRRERADSAEREVATLKAEMAKYTEPLTEEQAGDLAQAGDWPITPRGWKIIDAAIRRVRRGE